ncbi:MAG: DUF692 family protein [Nitrospirae bacterium]|nr:DUF692 family protein [Nitrospirota bacterium]
MTSTDQDFLRRVSRIPHHGLGLSVDVYTPPLCELLDAMESRGLDYGYLEIFKAASSALAAVRGRLPSALLEYHAEGLWVTQPDWTTHYPFETDLIETATHLRTLGSYWMTHECATKQMAGYSFGTYLPPLFTRASAEVTAGNIVLAQRHLDRCGNATEHEGPLLLLEMPPLTYFGFGDFRIASFFRRIAELAPCGMVLDLGHLWTVYRYAGEWRRRSLSEFLSEFLEAFPLERVVQLHVAGLAVHERSAPEPPASSHSLEQAPARLPWWIDAHGAPIPAVLFDMLEQVLAHPKLTGLKGMALEVDTKSVPQIVAEFERFRGRFGEWAHRWACRAAPEGPCRGSVATDPVGGLSAQAASVQDTSGEESRALLRHYDLYARVVTGATRADELSSLGSEPGALERYTRTYLPHEILTWGGTLRDMFPETCRWLAHAGVSLDAFVDYWLREPRQVRDPYDFFLLKLDRFPAFVREVLPRAAETVEWEAAELRDAYQAACEDVGA